MNNIMLTGDKESCDKVREEFVFKYMNNESEETTKLFFLLLGLLEKKKSRIEEKTILEYLNMTEIDMLDAIERLTGLKLITLEIDNQNNLQVIINSIKKPEFTVIKGNRISEEQFQREEKLNEIYFVAEGILRRILEQSEMDRLEYLYEGLQMSSQNIVELLEFIKTYRKSDLLDVISIAEKWKEKGYIPLNEMFHIKKKNTTVQRKKTTPAIMPQYYDIEEIEREAREEIRRIAASCSRQNKFDFPQRDYDFETLEKELMNN